jgi:hypothetical protein
MVTEQDPYGAILPVRPELAQYAMVTEQDPYGTILPARPELAQYAMVTEQDPYGAILPARTGIVDCCRIGSSRLVEEALQLSPQL